MDGQTSENTPLCPADELSSYLDGELAAAENVRIEEHLAKCAACRAELNFQKSLLNHLNSELAADSGFDLPDDFSRRVVAAAESRVSGLRSPSELRSAALILLAFGGFAAFFLTSFNIRGELPGIGIAEKLIGAAILLVHFVYDLSIAFAAFTRAFSRLWVLSAIISGSLAVCGLVLVFATRCARRCSKRQKC